MIESLTNKEAMEKSQDELIRIVDGLGSDLPTANIMVAGITGSGKSTLINAIFGNELAETGTGRPVTQQIKEYHPTDQQIRIWDTVGFEINAETTQASIEAIRTTIAKKAEDPDPFNRIHAIWFCVNSRGSRYQGAEVDFVKSLHTIGVPFIIVITQCVDDEDTVNEFERKVKETNNSVGMSDIETVQVIAKEFKIRGQSTIEPFGLDALVDLTLAKLPSFIKISFSAAQKVSKVQKRTACEDIIVDCVQAAKTGFWDKIPFANIISANNHIRNMLHRIGEMYNTQIPRESIERIVKESSIDFSNVFWGLISPVDFGYNKRILALLDMKKNDEGFDVDMPELKKSDRVAWMIALYGYTFIDSIEEVWEQNTKEQLKDIDRVCDELIRSINKRLGEKIKK